MNGETARRGKKGNYRGMYMMIFVEVSRPPVRDWNQATEWTYHLLRSLGESEQRLSVTNATHCLF
jgi:hypothetical protein